MRKVVSYQLLAISKRLCGAIVIMIFVAACDDLIPTATLQATLTGPTLEASPIFRPQPPTEVPFDENDMGQSDPTAAALPADAALPPLAVGTPVLGSAEQHVQITAEDGTMLDADLYQSGETRMPGVLMLAPDRSAWGEFPAKVHEAGFTVLSVNLRANAPPGDFTVMLQSLSSGEADPARLAVIGADAGADAALAGCAGDLLCDSVMLLSPSGDTRLLKDMTAFNPRPIFLAASQDDAISFDMIQKLQTGATGQVLFQPFTSAGHGTDLLVIRPDLGDLMIAWLQQELGN